jgi:hypothetical protein
MAELKCDGSIQMSTREMLRKPLTSPNDLLYSINPVMPGRHEGTTDAHTIL